MTFRMDYPPPSSGGAAGGEAIGNAVQGVSGVFTDKLATSATGQTPIVTDSSEGPNISVGTITGRDLAGKITFTAADEVGPGTLFGIDFAITKTNQPNVKVYPLNADWATNAGGTQPYASVRADGSGFDIVVGTLINAGSYLIGYDVIDEVNLVATTGGE